MKRESKKDEFPVWKTPLPQMSAQDKRQFLADLKNGFDSSGEVTLCIKFTDDILSADGKKKFENKKMKSIEQIDVTPIKDDSLINPSQLKNPQQRENIFEAMDVKIAESKRIAKKIQSDFEALNIPPPKEKIEVEPLFADYNQPVQVIERDLSSRTTKQKKETQIVYKNSSNKYPEDGRKRAMKTIEHAEKTLSTQKTKTKKPNKSTTGQINWAKVNEYIQEDDDEDDF